LLAAAPVVKVARTTPKPVEPAPPEEFSFTLASFNVLGSQHTARGGDKPGYATGASRARWSLTLMDDRGYDVAGVQEAQPDQMAVLLSSGVWKSYPDAASSPEPATAQSVVWRDDVWRLVAGRSFPIPFLDGSRPQPMVLLRHRATGREMWFVNVHLTPRHDLRDGEGERDEATRALAAQVRFLRETGLPIVVTGDMNEHGEIFCDLTSSTALVAASGGSNSGRCLPPRMMRVDWIFGTPDLQWSAFRFAQDPQVRRVTDHTIPVVEVTVPGL
jgi:endonuclease/exonuclease/phosphatase family metal-dependent hydrolase